MVHSLWNLGLFSIVCNFDRYVFVLLFRFVWLFDGIHQCMFSNGKNIHMINISNINDCIKSKQPIQLLIAATLIYFLVLCKDYFIFVYIRLFKLYFKDLGMFKCVKVIDNQIVGIKADILLMHIEVNEYVVGLALAYYVFILIIQLIMFVGLQHVFKVSLFLSIVIVYGTILKTNDFLFGYDVMNVFIVLRNTVLNHLLSDFMVFIFVTSDATIITRQAIARTTKINNGSLGVDFDATAITGIRAAYANVVNNHLFAVCIDCWSKRKTNRNEIAKKPKLEKKIKKHQGRKKTEETTLNRKNDNTADVFDFGFGFCFLFCFVLLFYFILFYFILFFVCQFFSFVFF